MKLKNLYIKDFQSIKGEFELDLEKLSFLYGPNSAGKSSVIDAFAILRTIVTEDTPKFFEGATLGFSAEFVDSYENHLVTEEWGILQELFSTKGVRAAVKELLNRKISYRVNGSGVRPRNIEIKVDDDYLLAFANSRQNLLNLLSNHSQDFSRVLTDEIRSKFVEDDDYSAIAINKSFKNTIFLLEDWLDDREYRDPSYVEEIGDYIVVDLELTEFLTLTGDEYWSGDNAMALLDPLVRFFNALKLIIRELFRFNHLSHVKGDRQVIAADSFYYDRDYLSTKKAVPIEGIEFSRDTPYGRWAEKYFSDSNESVFANICFERYLKSLKGYKLQLEEDTVNSDKVRRFKIENRQGDILDFVDVGSGLSYVFPIVGSLSFFGVTFVEQPELHLHPAAQCEIADVLIAARSLGHSAVVESHSEHLLLRVLRRIRETTKGYLIREELKLRCDDVVILYFNPDSDGRTNVIEIRIDEHGEFLNNWPDGFFSEREKELFQEYWEGAPNE